MSELHLNVDGLKLSKISDYKPPCSRCVFHFSGPEWKQCKVVAIFEKSGKEYLSAITKNGECSIPEELVCSTFFRVTVLKATKDSKNSTNTVLITKEV